MTDLEIYKYYKNLLEYEKMGKNILLTDSGIKEWGERIERHTRVLELLEGQRSVTPVRTMVTETMSGKMMSYTHPTCGHCGEDILETFKVCPYCGTKILWGGMPL